MFCPAEAKIHPDNREGTKRIFVVSGMDQERILHLASRVMDVYALVTGVKYVGDCPEGIVDHITGGSDVGLRYGMPRLKGPAHDNGKLWIGPTALYLQDGQDYSATKFWADTNDTFSRSDPIRPTSQALIDDFDAEVRTLADQEFEDVTVPIPEGTFNMRFYSPAEPPRF